MSNAIDELIKAKILRLVVRRRRQIDMADMVQAKSEKPLPDVPLHQRDFGVMDEPLA